MSDIFDPSKLNKNVIKAVCRDIRVDLLQPLGEWKVMMVEFDSDNGIEDTTVSDFLPISFIKIKEGGLYHYYGIGKYSVTDYGVSNKLDGYDPILDRTISVDKLTGEMISLNGEYKFTNDPHVFFNNECVINLRSKSFVIPIKAKKVHVDRINAAPIINLNITPQDGTPETHVRVYRGKKLPDNLTWFIDHQRNIAQFRTDNTREVYTGILY